MITHSDRKKSDPVLLVVLLLLVVLTVFLGSIVWSIPINRQGLEMLVSQKLNQSGVVSPVTAVLLNFRGYDTLLEVMVLFLAALGCWSMTEVYIPSPLMDASPIQTAIVRLLVPLMIIAAAYMVWQGSHFAGGAFQGGALLGGIGVLLLVSNLPWLRNVPVKLIRGGLAAGPLFFLAVAAFCLLLDRDLLQYPIQWSGSLILLIEVVCAVSIGLTLAALFAGGRPAEDLPPLIIPRKRLIKRKKR